MIKVNKSGYTIKKWNSIYGKNAQFIVQDNDSKEYGILSPSNPTDFIWARKDITKIDPYIKWEEFADEQVANLNEISF